MATLPRDTQIHLEGVPENLRPYLEPVAAFVREVSEALSNGLTPSENGAAGWYEFTYNSATGTLPRPFLMPTLGKREPYAVQVVRILKPSTAPTSPVWVHWNTVADGTAIRVRILAVLGVSGTATIRVKVEAQ